VGDDPVYVVDPSAESEQAASAKAVERQILIPIPLRQGFGTVGAGAARGISLNKAFVPATSEGIAGTKTALAPYSGS
jgi:hypothetical protein